ncbi:tetraacyldisaccharide 4'-kinase [Vreelandella massiliensis]|uniref:tetraacyldisaccharide 4'-kinase n=1 Tax=Vreelandella massiliensis TaxID=1816686 RepID=UPI00096A98F3|nr:tetraacyldisaccharide 4'-kinase [Halomonas massiliensis]
MSLAERWLKAAYRGSVWLYPLRPLGALYAAVMARREAAYHRGKRPVWRAPVPVIVVGNITLGGTGKSPLVAWLARWLSERGYRPGIVTRGYGGRAPRYPLWVTPDTPVSQSGDEPLMLAQQTGLPVVADPKRARGAEQLVAAGCDVIISDDGLQHLALGRDIELAVVDGARGLGNGRCLPAGPLREPPERLKRVDALLINGGPQTALPSLGKALDKRAATPMRLEPIGWRELATNKRWPLSPLPFTLPVHALAGIGRPERFFATLKALGVYGEWHAFPDHYRFDAASLCFAPAEKPRPLVMTAKDAVKCRDVAPPDSWVLDVEATLTPEFEQWLTARLATLSEEIT